MKPIPIASILINIFLFVHSNTCYKPIKEIQVDESSRLNMTVFIESKCKFSKKFIQEQLQPIYDEIKDKINIKFVTFALSEVNVLFIVFVSEFKRISVVDFSRHI